MNYAKQVFEAYKDVVPVWILVKEKKGEFYVKG